MECLRVNVVSGVPTCAISIVVWIELCIDHRIGVSSKCIEKEIVGCRVSREYLIWFGVVVYCRVGKYWPVGFPLEDMDQFCLHIHTRHIEIPRRPPGWFHSAIPSSSSIALEMAFLASWFISIVLVSQSLQSLNATRRFLLGAIRAPTYETK